MTPPRWKKRAMRSRRVTPNCSAFDTAVIMTSELPKISVAETLAQKIVALKAGTLLAATTRKCEDLLIDVVGLCVTARNEDYITSALGGWDDDGPCTALGHKRTLNASGAAFVNGTAAHGEDFDDTFEGGPVHAGAVVVPAVLAAAEQERRSGASALVGIAGSMASGIIEYLAEGTWTKRMHPGWAAQSGLRAALLGRAGFSGPRTVFEGVHGLFAGFARTSEGNYPALLDGFGQRWLMAALAFKPYPCGTMIQPYVDCARRLGKRARLEELAELVAGVAEGTVHRLWEPLADKQRPPNGYAGKFSAPYCIASVLVRGTLGLDAFSDAAVA